VAIDNLSFTSFPKKVPVSTHTKELTRLHEVKIRCQEEEEKEKNEKSNRKESYLVWKMAKNEMHVIWFLRQKCVQVTPFEWNRWTNRESSVIEFQY